MDDKTERGGQDRKCIGVKADYELRDWSKKVCITTDELKKVARTWATAQKPYRSTWRTRGVDTRWGAAEHLQAPEDTNVNGLQCEGCSICGG